MIQPMNLEVHQTINLDHKKPTNHLVNQPLDQTRDPMTVAQVLPIFIGDTVDIFSQLWPEDPAMIALARSCAEDPV